jgi:hypothetical protein
MKKPRRCFAVYIDNTGYQASLIPRNGILRMLPLEVPACLQPLSFCG